MSFVLILLCETVLFSQLPNSTEIDSLKKVFSNLDYYSGKIDKNLVKEAVILTDYYSRIRLDSAKFYAFLAYNIAKQLNNPTAEAITLNSIGMSYTSAGYYDSAAPYLDSALNIFKKIKDTTGITFVQNNLAVVSMRRGDYVKALEYYHQNLDYAIKQKNNENMLLGYNNIGILYFDWKKYDDALESYRNALKILDKTGEEERKGTVYNNIGEVYQAKGETPKAKEYYNKSLIINKKYGKKRSILISISSLGDIFYKEGKYKEALQYYKEALDISKKIPDDVNISLMKIKTGKVLTKQGHYKEAEKYIKEGLELAKSIKVKNNQLEAYRALMDNSKGLKKSEKLYDYTQKYIALKDSIFNDKSMTTINELETKYKTAQKEKEIALLTAETRTKELELQKQRNQKYFLIITILLVLFAGYLLFNRYRIKQIKIKSELEKAKISIEQRLLRSQMNPHFIFNSLNSINSFIGSNNPVEAQAYLSKFARLMRLILENSRKTNIPLEDELQALELNLELEKLRFQNRFDFKIEVADDIDPEDIYISPMLIQPFIENSIKHGFTNKKEKGIINISFKKEEGLLVCTVEDNGIGRAAAETLKKEKRKGHVSLGTQVTGERFEALKDININAGFEIIDLKDAQGNATGTRVIIKIPYEEE